MQIEEVISEIRGSVTGLLVQDDKEVIQAILRSRNAVFLDTCFISRMANEKSIEKIMPFFTKMEAVFIVTDLLLYEMKDSEGNYLQKNNYHFFECMKKAGLTVVLLNESNIFQMLSEYVKYSDYERNSLLVKALNENVANLTKLSQLIMKDKNVDDIFAEGYIIPKSKDFVTNFIDGVKSRKSNQDSLAEELISLCVIILLGLPGKTKYYFCSNDLAAQVRYNKSIYTSCLASIGRAETMNTFTIIQYMIKESLLKRTDEEWIVGALKDSIGEAPIVYERKELPGQSCELKIQIEDIVKRCFEGECFDLRGR